LSIHPENEHAMYPRAAVGNDVMLSSRVLVSDKCKQWITVSDLLLLAFYWHRFKAW